MSKIVLLENIRSLHNVGSVFRIADGAGWGKVILTGYTGTPPDRRIEKVSLGAEDFVEWEQIADPIAAIQKYKDLNYEIIALEQTSKSTQLFDFASDSPNQLLILGNEVEGVSPDLLKLADHHLEIPMHGQKGSLNVSVAAGVAMYVLNNFDK